jgi:hypothetical protein
MATKKVKYPKKPKQTASLQTWEKYHDKIKEVDKRNAEIEKEKKKKADLIKKVSGLRK